ncbi:MAG: aminoacylase [Verrucomicrobia bacterium]|nr:MAG: aminoacylase [Verrucomicrobiota bacterium]
MNQRRAFVFSCASLLALNLILPLPLHSETYDTIIRHGRVVDGTGNPAFYADVAIKDGRIAGIGTIAGEAKRQIDAKGLIVAPGFIDVHTHADDVALNPRAENFVRMGVTTIVAGNCGGSPMLDFAKFFRQIEETNVAVNVASLVGHNSVRASGMGGDFDRPPTAEELEKMKAQVKQAMEDGAVGLSTGLIYQPGVFAKTDEIIALAKVAAAHGGIYTSHMRYEDTKIYEALDEVFRIARESGARAEVSHIKLSGPSAWGQAEKVLAYIEKARAEGLDITQDQYAYTASSTGMSQLIPDKALEGGRRQFNERITDKAYKEKVIAQMKESLHDKGRKDYSYAVIASCRHDPSLDGLNIPEAARAKRGSDSLDDQIEMILDIQSQGGASGVFHGMSEDDLKIFMRHPNTMIACDSGIRMWQEGVPHPRGYGNNARVLGRYVREMKVLRLEDAIRKMTSLPAETLHFKERGQVREGFWADLVIFDPEKVLDTATYKDPHHYPEGIPYVLVNGVLVIDAGQHTGAKAGQALRNGTTWERRRPAGESQS